MSRINLFLDSSALIAGFISTEGASRALLLLGEDEKIQLTVSEQVIAEIDGTWRAKRRGQRHLPGR